MLLPELIPLRRTASQSTSLFFQGLQHGRLFCNIDVCHLLLVVRIADSLCTNGSLEVNVSVNAVTSGNLRPELHASKSNHGLEVVIEVVIVVVIAAC